MVRLSSCRRSKSNDGIATGLLRRDGRKPAQCCGGPLEAMLDIFRGWHSSKPDSPDCRKHLISSTQLDRMMGWRQLP